MLKHGVSSQAFGPGWLLVWANLWVVCSHSPSLPSGVHTGSLSQEGGEWVRHTEPWASCTCYCCPGASWGVCRGGVPRSSWWPSCWRPWRIRRMDPRVVSGISLMSLKLQLLCPQLPPPTQPCPSPSCSGQGEKWVCLRWCPTELDELGPDASLYTLTSPVGDSRDRDSAPDAPCPIFWGLLAIFDLPRLVNASLQCSAFTWHSPVFSYHLPSKDVFSEFNFPHFLRSAVIVDMTSFYLANLCNDFISK